MLDLYILFNNYRMSAASNTLRFGQWYLNNYAPERCWPELFYEKNDMVAFEMIQSDTEN